MTERGVRARRGRRRNGHSVRPPAAALFGLALALLFTLVPVTAGMTPAAAARKRWDPIRVAPVTLRRPAVLITPGENLPNPDVVKVGKRYLMFASQEILYVPVSLLVSTSLTKWGKKLLDPLPRLPRWAQTNYTWSPDVREVDGRYLMWFSAGRAGKKVAPMKCIGVATARSIYGPYVSHERKPLICQTSHYGSIDPRTFLAPDGRLWLLWKSDDNAHWTTATRTILFSQRLSANGLRLVGKRYELLTANEPWENGIIEAPDMVFAHGRYWLFYSGNWFNQPYYAIGLAQCAGPAGPCRPSPKGPWLASNAQGTGPGEETVFYDGSRWWLLYAPSAVDYTINTNRPAALARLVFSSMGPRVVRPGTRAWSTPAARPPAPRPRARNFFLGR